MSELTVTDAFITEIITEENTVNHGNVELRRKRKPGPNPGSHHAKVRLKKDGIPKQKAGPKPGSKHKINSGNWGPKK